MKMTSREVGFLQIIADDVDAYLKMSASVKPESSSIVRTMNMVLPKLFLGYHFTTNWEYSKEPYIACIRPDIGELSKKSKELVTILNDPKKGTSQYLDKWAEIKTWEISLDPRIVTKGHPCCVDNGRQFVGILCHEIGHVMNHDPMELITTYREQMRTASKVEKMMYSDNTMVRKLILPMFIRTESFRVILKDEYNYRIMYDRAGRIEMAADAYIPPEFAPDLVDYIERHILTRPDTAGLVQDVARYKNDQQVSVEFSRSVLDLMEKRRDVLKKQIHAQHQAPDADDYTKRLMNFLGSALGKYDPATDTTNQIQESVEMRRFVRENTDINKAATALLESLKVTPRDLDILELDAKRIRSTEEQLFIIQSIYDYMEAVAKQQADQTKKLQKQGLDDAQIKKVLNADGRMDRLANLRKEVMNMEITDVPDSYGLYIRYPKGYEG